MVIDDFFGTYFSQWLNLKIIYFCWCDITVINCFSLILYLQRDIYWKRQNWVAKMRRNTNGLPTNGKRTGEHILNLDLGETKYISVCLVGRSTHQTHSGGEEPLASSQKLWVVEMASPWIEPQTGSPQREGFEICSSICQLPSSPSIFADYNLNYLG